MKKIKFVERNLKIWRSVCTWQEWL